MFSSFLSVNALKFGKMIILVAVLQFYALQKKTDHDLIEQSTQLNPKEKYRFGQGFLCQ